jgi:hypothetical protein
MMYSGKISELRLTLTKDKEIQLLDFHSFPPVEEHVVSSIEKIVGYKLPKQMVEFYKTTNGLQLRWVKSDREVQYKEDVKNSGTPFPWLWPAEHYWQLDGIINVLSLEEIFLKDYKDFIWFDFEKEYEVTWRGKKINLQEFKKSIKPLDVYDKYYTVAILIDDPSLPVMLGEDHNADFLNYRHCDFKSYMEFLFQSKGEVDKRKAFFLQDKE